MPVTHPPLISTDFSETELTDYCVLYQLECFFTFLDCDCILPATLRSDGYPPFNINVFHQIKVFSATNDIDGVSSANIHQFNEFPAFLFALRFCKQFEIVISNEFDQYSIFIRKIFCQFSNCPSLRRSTICLRCHAFIHHSYSAT